MKALNFITAAVAFVATLGLVGCSGDGIVEFQPQDELDKAALAVAKEKYPDEKFYRYVDTDGKDSTKGEANYYGKDYNHHYTFVFFKDKNDKNKRFTIYIKCSSQDNKCVPYHDGEDQLANHRKQGRTK